MAPKRSATPGPKAAAAPAKQSGQVARPKRSPSSGSLGAAPSPSPAAAPSPAARAAPAARSDAGAVAAARGPPPAARSEGSGVREPAVVAAAAGSGDRGLRRDKVAPRRPTDCGCLLVLVAFIGFLVALRLRGHERGDLKRLTNGFDFRGRLCDDRDSGAFLHWCAHEGRTLWEAPVCVRRCPDAGDLIMCPVFSEEEDETREHLKNGSVVLTKKTRHVLTPLSAGATRKHWRFCVPQALGSDGLESLVGGDSWQEYFFQQAGHILALLNAPRLVASLVACAVWTAVLWVLLLSKCTEALLRVQFLFCGVAVAGSGLLLTVRAVAAANRSGSKLATLLSRVTPQLQGAAAGVDGLLSSGLEAMHLQGMLQDHFGFLGPVAQICIGLCLAAVGAGVLVWYMVSKKTIAVAADCSREACKVAFRSPSLALLPLLEVLLYVVVLFETMYSLALLLSTADVKPRDIEIFSLRIAGLHRSIHWNVELVLQTLSWIFAFLWLSEMVTALRSFVLSKVAVIWYFEPASRRRCCRLPILDGTITALAYHLGSLALGSFVMACLRGFHWFFMAVHKLAGEQKDQNRCFRCCLGCFEFLIALAQQLARHLSKSAYTDLAITSSSLISASSNAAKLLVDGAGLTAIRSMFLRPVMLIGNVMYAAAFSWGTWLLLDSLDDGEGFLAARLPKAFAEEKAMLGSSAALAVFAGVAAFAVVRAFTAVVEDIADAVLYCYLWDRSDGVVDADDVPASFKELVGKMAVATGRS